MDSGEQLSFSSVSAVCVELRTCYIMSSVWYIYDWAGSVALTNVYVDRLDMHLHNTYSTQQYMVYSSTP